MIPNSSLVKFSDAALPPAGWYPDPSGARRQRYFDGSNWTRHYAVPLGESLITARPPWWRRPKNPIIAAGIVLTAAAIGVIAYLPTRPSLAPGETVLPFTGLSSPDAVAVDSAGDVFVADFHNNQVVKLAPASGTQTVLPFTGLKSPNGVAVDNAGDVYVTDSGNDRVVKLAAGSSTQEVLPFTGHKNPNGVAVDTAGTVYVADTRNYRVVKLAAGSSTQTVLPYSGSTPEGVAADTAGNVYVGDAVNHRVVKLAAH